MAKKVKKRQANKAMQLRNRVVFIVLIIFVAITAVIALTLGNIMSPVDAKDGKTIEMSVPEGSTLDDISKQLKENDLIKSAGAFKIYVKLNGDGANLKAGYYSLSQKYSGNEIIEILKKGGSGETMTLTIREGLDLNRIGRYLQKQGFCTKKEFLNEIKTNEDYYRKNYDFLSSVPKDREYILEGYLFGDTYEMYKNALPKDLIEKMLQRFDEVYTNEYRKKTKDMGKSIDEIVTMASVVEREGIVDSELPIIAGVFYNRLDKSMMLQSCATLQYIYQDYQFSFTESQKNVESPYNTYKYEGLPAGPISNFREAALKAALYPEKTNYLYFCTKNDGTGESAFAESIDGHDENIRKYSGNWE